MAIDYIPHRGVRRSQIGSKSWHVFLFCALMLAKSGVSALAAEDPARFFQVTKWIGTFDRIVTNSGSASYPQGAVRCDIYWTINDTAHITNEFPLLSHIPGAPDATWYSSPTESFSHWSINEYLHEKCDQDSHDFSARTFVPTNSSGGTLATLRINLTNGTYRITGDFDGSYIYTADGGDFPVPQGILWWPSSVQTNPIVEPLPDTGLVLTGSRRYPLKGIHDLGGLSAATGDAKDYLAGELIITWQLEPESEALEVVVEPKGYEKWLPKGNLKNPTQRGNSINILATLQKKGGGTPDARATSFQFDLLNVSAEPGVCMNFPVKSPSLDQDLQFEDELNLPGPGQQTSVTSNSFLIYDGRGMLKVAAKVSSFDFGAYGELRVTAELPNHPPIIGYLKGDPQKSTIITIPKVNQASHIASAWISKYGGGAGLSDDLDRDSFPEGDGHQGDGLSLYEEYRGFSVNRTNIRTSPIKKDLFVRDEIAGGQAQSGILQFEQASHLAVHGKLRKDELNADAVINFNHGWKHNAFDQHALVLVGRQQKRGFSRAEPRAGALGNSTPGSITQLTIEPTGDRDSGIDTSTGGALEYSQFELSSVPHEIGHGCSVWHHGECDINGTNFNLRWVLLPDDSHLELRMVGGTPSGTPITILNPDGTVPLLLRYSVTTNGIRYQTRAWMAVPQGQHSGDISCFMCYPAADCFRRDMSEKRYLNQIWPALRRDHFCTSSDGTGVNAAGTPGGPWLGGAYQAGGGSTKDRGNCASQICVDDLYIKDKKHDRTSNTCPPW